MIENVTDSVTKLVLLRLPARDEDVLKTNNPLARHSRGVNSTSALADSGLPTFGAGGNPAITNILRSRQNHDVVPLRGRYLIIWIPACAGMTQFCANGLFRLLPEWRAA